MTHKIKVIGVEIELTAEMIKEINALPDESEFEYPLFKRNKADKNTVMFTSFYNYEVVWSYCGNKAEIGRKGTHIYAHTQTDVWQPVPYDKERGLWHGQPSAGWDDEDTHFKAYGFYDAINKCMFSIYGTLEGTECDNIEAIR